MEMTLNTKRTIFYILVLIMKADLVCRKEEIAFLDKVFNDFGLSVDEFDHMEGIDFDYLKKEFSTFPDEHKQYAKQLFVEMANCDGFADPREMEIINKL